MKNLMQKTLLACLPLALIATMSGNAHADPVVQVKVAAPAHPVKPAPWKKARYLHRRIDVNDDGRIGPRERRYARKLRRHADVNGDGHLGPRERHAARHVLNQVDRRY